MSTPSNNTPSTHGSNELRPCPFCGSSSVKLYAAAVFCDDCGAAGPASKSKHDKVVDWNTRVPPSLIKPTRKNGRYLASGADVCGKQLDTLCGFAKHHEGPCAWACAEEFGYESLGGGIRELVRALGRDCVHDHELARRECHDCYEEAVNKALASAAPEGERGSDELEKYVALVVEYADKPCEMPGRTCADRGAHLLCGPCRARALLDAAPTAEVDRGGESPASVPASPAPKTECDHRYIIRTMTDGTKRAGCSLCPYDGGEVDPIGADKGFRLKPDASPVHKTAWTAEPWPELGHLPREAYHIPRYHPGSRTVVLMREDYERARLCVNYCKELTDEELQTARPRVVSEPCGNLGGWAPLQGGCDGPRKIAELERERDALRTERDELERVIESLDAAGAAKAKAEGRSYAQHSWGEAAVEAVDYIRQLERERAAAVETLEGLVLECTHSRDANATRLPSLSAVLAARARLALLKAHAVNDL